MDELSAWLFSRDISLLSISKLKSKVKNPARIPDLEDCTDIEAFTAAYVHHRAEAKLLIKLIQEAGMAGGVRLIDPIPGIEFETRLFCC